jgi:PAS domain S-box-containing protein
MTTRGEQPKQRADRPTPATGGSRRLLDGLIEGCQVIGFDWTYLYVNDAVLRQGRRSREELLGRTMSEAYPGIEHTRVYALIRDCLERRTRHQLENEFVFADGNRGWFELRIEPVPDGAFVLSLDVTERKRAEQRAEHLAAVLRGIRNVNRLIARERDSEALVESACRLLVEARGFYSCAIVRPRESGLAIATAGTGDAKLTELRALLERGELPGCIRNALETGEPEPRQPPTGACVDCPANRDYLVARDAVAVPIASSGHSFGAILVSVPPGMASDAEEIELLRDVAGDLGHALGALEMAEEHDRLQSQYLHAQKMEAVGRFAGGIAHDFNNLLSIVLTYSDFAIAALRPEDPLRADLTEIRKAAESATGLTRQLLAFSRKQVLSLQVLDLNSVVRGIEGMLRRLIGEEIELVTRLAPDLGRVTADPAQLEQVLMNLAVNARDAIPGVGRLAIETADVELDDEYARQHVTVQPGSYVMLAVSDTGSGMDEATRARLFEPFFTTKEAGKGTGLGLATVYGIVKQSGGNIWVYSEPGRGTTFRIYLPLERAGGEPPRRAPVAPSGGGDETILLVEDQDALRRVVERILTAAGYTVVAAANGHEALDVAERHSGRIDLVLTDLVMPEMGGGELVTKLAARFPGLRVLFMSGYSEDAVGALEGVAPGSHLISKPFAAAELTGRVRSVLDS